MGCRGLIGFIQKGVYRGAFNHWDSDPSGLGDAIIKFILAHTDEELEDMISKVEQVRDRRRPFMEPVLRGLVEMDLYKTSPGPELRSVPIYTFSTHAQYK
jgi:hypothetical protein